MPNSHSRNVSNLLSGVFWATLSHISVMAFAMLTIVFAARTLSKEQIGYYYFILVILQLVTTLGDPGLRAAAIRFISKSSDHEASSFSSFFLTVGFGVSAVAAAILWFSKPLLLATFSQFDIVLLLQQLLPLVIVTITFQMLLSILAGHKMFGLMSSVTFLTELIRFGISLFVLLFDYGVYELILAMTASKIFGSAVILIKASSIFSRSIQPSDLKDVFKFSGWSYGASIVSVIQARTAEFILSGTLGPTALANYSTAMQIPGAMQRIIEFIRPVLLSHVASREINNEASVLLIFRLLCGIGVLITMIAITLSNFVVVGIFGSGFREIVPVFQVLSVWFTLTSINYLLAIYLLGSGNGYKVFVLSLPQAIVMIASALILTAAYAELGAAFALMISSLVGAWTSLLSMDQQSTEGGKELHKIFIKCVLLLIIFLVVQFIWGAIPLVVWISVALGMVAVFFLNLLEFNDLKLFLGFVKGFIKNEK